MAVLLRIQCLKNPLGNVFAFSVQKQKKKKKKLKNISMYKQKKVNSMRNAQFFSMNFKFGFKGYLGMGIQCDENEITLKKIFSLRTVSEIVLN